MSKTRSKPKRATAGPSPQYPLRLEWMKAGELTPNPLNWRKHPPGQLAALKATLDAVGWAGSLLYNEVTGRLIDGHARREVVPPETLVPVLVGRWTPDQEQRLLASLDPLAGMAVPDIDALAAIMPAIPADAALAGLKEHLEGLMESLAPEDADAGPSADKPAAVPELHHVVIDCDGEATQIALFERLKAEGLKCKMYTL